MLSPLISQLLTRATYIIKRLFEIVENIMESKKKRNPFNTPRENQLDISVTKDFPQFVWFVKDLYEEVVEATAKKCLEQCSDELLCTRLIYWEQTSESK